VGERERGGLFRRWKVFSPYLGSLGLTSAGMVRPGTCEGVRNRGYVAQLDLGDYAEWGDFAERTGGFF